jgi:hypothetical protein
MLGGTGAALLEQLSRRKLIDLYYAAESRVCVQGYVPYGWQFADEDVFVPSSQGAGLNCFALLTRANVCRFATTNCHHQSVRRQRFYCGTVRATFLWLAANDGGGSGQCARS